MQNGGLPSGPGRAGTAGSLDRFHERPILNSPYEHPGRHWELDDGNRPTNRVIARRRPSAYISPIPRARRHEGRQPALVEGAAARADPSAFTGHCGLTS